MLCKEKEVVIMKSSEFETLDHSEIGQHWGWFLVLGIFMIVIGALAVGSSLMVTLFSMLFLGWLMIFAGVGEVVHAFWKKKWGGVFMHLLVGVLYLVVGFMVLTNPKASAVTLALIMAIFFILTGIFRIILSVAAHYPNWGWELFNGIVTLILGIMIYEQPLLALWLIGVFIGVDLIFSGWAWVMLSLAARRLAAAPG
jgi:uncharacterized membrane protein HdeD (DUF308 family)